MSGKRKFQRIEESVKKPKLDAEISDKFRDTKDIPDVVWQKIFGFLSWKEIKLNVAQVCKHFYEISNDCVQEIIIEDEKIFASEENKCGMFGALSTFKFLKTIKVDTEMSTYYSRDVEYFLMHALINCPRLRFIETCHELFGQYDK